MNKDTIIKGMETYGGGFIKALASALEVADAENTAKIFAAWPDEAASYQRMGEALEADLKTEQGRAAFFGVTENEEDPAHDDNLLIRLRSGELKYYQEDVMEVTRHYIERKMFHNALDVAGLNLPDPGDEEKNALHDLEVWMIGALREMNRLSGSPIKTDDEYRETLNTMVSDVSNKITQP